MKIGKALAALQHMTATELRRQHLEVFGEPTKSGNKEYLLKRIAWRMQAQAEGGLSDRARVRARALENDADLRLNPPRKAEAGLPADVVVQLAVDHRLPMPGTMLTREYKGQKIVVHVLPKGFEWEGEIYRSLTALVSKITGSHWNGYDFFRLTKKARCA